MHSREARSPMSCRVAYLQMHDPNKSPLDRPAKGLPYPDRILPSSLIFRQTVSIVNHHRHHETTLYFVCASGSSPLYKPPALDGGVRPKGIITAVSQYVFRSGPGDLVDRVSTLDEVSEARTRLSFLGIRLASQSIAAGFGLMGR